MSDDISAPILEILSKHAEEQLEEVDEQTTLEAMGIDSLATIEIIYDLEDHFDIVIPDPGEVEGVDLEFKTTGDVIKAITFLLDRKG